MKLNELFNNEGATKNRIRVGRGIGSGKGKTSGRGVKGQKARTGVSIAGFEGGQMPLYRRLPKRGFNQPNRSEFISVNLGKIQQFIDAGKIDISQPLTAAIFQSSGLVNQIRDGVRVLAKGILKAKLTIEANGFSETAKAAIVAVGGQAVDAGYTRAKKPKTESVTDKRKIRSAAAKKA